MPGEADDRVERRAQLVRHRGQEGRLQAVGRLGPIAGNGQIGSAFGDPQLQARVQIADGVLGSLRLRDVVPTLRISVI